MRGVLLNGPLAEKSGALPGIDHKSGNKALCLNLTQKEKKVF